MNPQSIFRRLLAKPSAVMLARAELEEAQRQLLQAQTAKEYAASMVTYHTSRISRLTEYIKTAHSGASHDE